MKYILLAIIIIIILAGAVFLFNKPQTQTTPLQTTPTPSPTIKQETNITASFTIITGNITRSFKSEKYHNRSADVYIEASDPTKVHVKKAGIRWDDFFKTLPMKLTKDCLTTGDGETYCSGQEGSLKFYLNDNEESNLLEKTIKEDDQALIRFSYF